MRGPALDDFRGRPPGPSPSGALWEKGARGGRRRPLPPGEGSGQRPQGEGLGRNPISFAPAVLLGPMAFAPPRGRAPTRVRAEALDPSPGSPRGSRGDDSHAPSAAMRGRGQRRGAKAGRRRKRPGSRSSSRAIQWSESTYCGGSDSWRSGRTRGKRNAIGHQLNRRPHPSPLGSQHRGSALPFTGKTGTLMTLGDRIWDCWVGGLKDDYSSDVVDRAARKRSGSGRGS